MDVKMPFFQTGGQGVEGSPAAHHDAPTQRHPSASHREEAGMAVHDDRDRLSWPCSEVQFGVGWAEKPSDGRTF